MGASRPIMVAVTKCNAAGTDCENPNNGWLTYELAEDDYDWAQIGVSRGLVMVNYRIAGPKPIPNAGNVYVFSAQSLINGTVPQHLPTPGVTFTAGSFPATGLDPSGATVSTNELTDASYIMFASMHGATSADYPTLVTMHHDFGANNVWVYNLMPNASDYLGATQSAPHASALWDLSPWISTLHVVPAGVVSVPSGMGQQWNAHPVWSAQSNAHGWPGTLYWSFLNTAGDGVSVFEWPMKATFGGPFWLQVQLSVDPAQGYREWDVGLGDTSHGYDFPLVEHNMMSGESLLVFHQLGTATPPAYVTAEYALDDVAAAPAVAATSTALSPVNIYGKPVLPSTGGAVDILSDVSDPIRPQVFFTSVVAGSAGYESRLEAVPMPNGAANPPVIPGFWPTATIAPGTTGLGLSSSVTIPFQSQSGTAVSVPLPTCTVGGDLGPRTQAGVSAPLGSAYVSTVSQQAVTVQFGASFGTKPGTYKEGISCSNGVSVPVTVTVNAPLFSVSPDPITVKANNCVWADVTFSQPCYVVNSTLSIGTPWPPGLASVYNGTGYTSPPQVEVCAGSATGTYQVPLSDTACNLTTNENLTVNVIPCTPNTCQPGNCGSIGDGCGGILNCGSTCSSPQVCAPSGWCCTPQTAAEACSGVQCGSVSDGCGGTLYCGGCQPGFGCYGGQCSYKYCPKGTVYCDGACMKPTSCY